MSMFNLSSWVMFSLLSLSVGLLLCMSNKGKTGLKSTYSIDSAVKHFTHLVTTIFPHWQPAQRLLHMVHGPQLITKAYQESNGHSFKVPTPSNDLLLITDPELVKEVNKAAFNELSLNGVARDLLQPQHTLPDFDWKDQRAGGKGYGYVRAIRALLTAHLPQMQPELESILKDSLDAELAKTDSAGWAHVPIYGVIKRVIGKMNCYMFFGKELSQNPEFCAAALDFPETTFIAAEITRILPSFLCPLGIEVVTKGRWAEKVLRKYLTPIVQERLERRRTMGDSPDPNAPSDCVQWLVDMSPRKDPWTTEKLVGQIFSLWFAPGFQTSMLATTMIQDLTLHSEYIKPLRAEIEEHLSDCGAPLNVENLPLLDSFMRESIRTSNSDAVTGRRKALEPFKFSDGSSLNVGDWVCIPMVAMMNDPQRYQNPEQFDGYRFTDANATLRSGETSPKTPDKAETSLTDASFDWPIWGVGQMSCPGRWFASLIMKLILVRVLTGYDVYMPETKGSRVFSWRTSFIPKEGTMVSFRKIKA